MPQFLVSDIRVTRHEAGDDLLSAGLGLDGLRAPLAAPLDATALDAAALRRRAIHSSWLGIADLSPGGGFGRVYGSVPLVPGREYQAFARVPGAQQPHRVLAQIPDAFDRTRRCLVVNAVSGSRGVYGAISIAGGWALPRGCAVVYTDKGAGSGLFDVDSGSGVRLDGTRAAVGGDVLEFEPQQVAGVHEVALKHAHSGDNPEADWGRHVIQAAGFGLHALTQAFPEQAPFTPQNTRIIALGLSNGGGAVLRAAELPEGDWFAAVVAAAPNVQVDGARPLFDYTSEAALYQPCALLDKRMSDAAWVLPQALLAPLAMVRCASLAAAGLLDARDPLAQGREAYERLLAGGWDEGALRLAPSHVGFDLWRAVGATYLSAYTRAGAAAGPCGHRFAALDPLGQPRATSPAERVLWWSDGSGIAPSVGIGIVERAPALPDPTFAGSKCLRDAWRADDELSRRLHAGVAATRAQARLRAPIIAVVHGSDDGLIPMAFTSRPWLQRALANNPHATIRLYSIEHAQHFDAFLGQAPFASRYVPLIPYAWRTLDLVWEALTHGTPLPPSALVQTTPRALGADGSVEPLEWRHLGQIESLGP